MDKSELDKSEMEVMMKITLSKSQWERIGKQAGWMKKEAIWSPSNNEKSNQVHSVMEKVYNILSTELSPLVQEDVLLQQEAKNGINDILGHFSYLS